MDAVSSVFTLPSSTLASAAIQDAIAMKIEEYPGKISKDQHVAHAHVPVGVAALLREYPTLVAPAVRAFCRRDQKDNKALRVMRHFPPELRILTSVRFSKALYAQICAHPYTPDTRTGWGSSPLSENALKAHQLGIKLACGFEILVCSAGGLTPSTPETPLQNENVDDLSTNPKWNKYRESLINKGYFRGELEGSKLYKELEANAKHYFVSNVLTGNGDNDEIVVGSVVVKLLNKVNTDYEFFKEREARLVPPDDESWLEITQDSLDDMLSSKFTPNRKTASNEPEIVDSLNKFLGHVSHMDGAEIPPELHDVLKRTSSDRKTSLNPRKPTHNRSASMSSRKVSSGRKTSLQHRKISSQSTTSQGSCASDMSSFSTKIDKNSEAFTDGVHNMLDLSLPEDEYWAQSDEDSSGMSSYGGDHRDPRELEELDELNDATRKTSNGSQDSGVTNETGTEPELLECIKQMEKELSQTKIGEMLNCAKSKKGKKYRKKSKKGIPLADTNEDLSDEEKEVDMEAVRDLVKAYAEEGGIEGPATSLLESIGARPQPAK